MLNRIAILGRGIAGDTGLGQFRRSSCALSSFISIKVASAFKLYIAISRQSELYYMTVAYDTCMGGRGAAVRYRQSPLEA
jgi:hypothetical protein